MGLVEVECHMDRVACSELPQNVASPYGASEKILRRRCIDDLFRLLACHLGPQGRVLLSLDQNRCGDFGYDIAG